MTKRNRSPDGKSQKERIKEITEQLEAGVTAVFESDAYKAFVIYPRRPIQNYTEIEIRGSIVAEMVAYRKHRIIGMQYFQCLHQF